MAEIQLENQRPQLAEGRVSARSIAWLVAISLLASAWLWAAFLRDRVHTSFLQALLLLPCMALVAIFAWLITDLVRWRFALTLPQAIRALAYSSAAFLLLAVFFPEYLLGKPVLIRSLILLAFSIFLFACYLGLSLQKKLLHFHGMSPALALSIFCALYFLLTSWITLTKLHNFGYVGQDIAYFTQCLYTTLHGQLLYSNMYHDLLYGQPVTSDLAGHNQLVLFFFLPFFALHKAASTLLILRNVSIALCAWPVYLIGRRFLPPGTAAISAVAFLLLPAVLYQNFYDFAPLSLAGLPLLFALYYYLEEKFVPYLMALICAQMVREDLVFAIFGLGLLGLWHRRSLRWVAVPCGFAMLWAFVSWQIMFPHFLEGATPAVASCFAYLGSNPLEMLRNMAHLTGILLSHKNLLYTKQMADPFGCVLFLLNPAWLISTPYVAINILAEGGGCNTAMIYRHYSLIPAVFLFAAVLLALKRIGAVAAKREHGSETAQTAIILFVFVAALSSTVFVTGQAQFEELKARSWHEEANRVAEMLPANAAVAVPRYMLPKVANRDNLYQSLRLLEYHHPDANYIVIDKDWQRMAASQQWKENYDALRHLLESSSQYQVTYDSANYIVYKLRDGRLPNLPHREPSKDRHD